MKHIMTSVFLTSVCAITSWAVCPEDVRLCPPPQKTACCYDAYRDPYRIAYPKTMPVPEQVEITATERAMEMRRAAVLRMRNMIQFEREILAAAAPLNQPAQSGVTVFGSTEGAGVYDTGNNPVPPAPPYPGPCPATAQVSPVQTVAVIQGKSGRARPIAMPVPGKPGYVYSPFTSERCVIDVQSLTPGSLARDPYTGRAFRVP